VKLWAFFVLVLGLAFSQAQVVVFSDNMESFPSGWTLEHPRGGTDWARMGDRYNSASYSAKCCNGTYYPPSITNRIVRYFDLSGYGAARLKFWRWVDLDGVGWDTIKLEFHTVTGWSTVWELHDGGDTVAVWRAESLDVPVTVDGIRFQFGCNNQLQGFGVYIDDVVLTGYYTDAGVTKIVAPTGTLDSGTTLTPMCSVYNYSSFPSSYRVLCRIGSSYRESTEVVSHPCGTSQLVAFPPWTVGPRGDASVRCSTMLPLDAQPGNDSRDTTCHVRVHDVGCSALLSLPTEVDSGYGVTPQAMVFNRGSETETFYTLMRIGNFYTDTRQTAGLAPGESALITFTSRILNGPRGAHVAQCSTMLGTDCGTTNDVQSLTITIRVHDVGAIAFVAPGPVVDSGELVYPVGQVGNFGTYTEDFRCIYRIGPFCDTRQVIGLAPGATLDVSFGSWRAMPGSYTRTCSTLSNVDLSTANDSVTGPLTVRYVDVGVTRILVPHTQILPGSLVPEVEVRNFGSQTATNCPVQLTIDPGYVLQSQEVTLIPGQTDTVSFPAWDATIGTYLATAKHVMAGDMNSSNDSVVKTVLVSTAQHHDVGVVRLLSPASTINPGDVALEVGIFNYGSVADSGFAVGLSIEGTGGQVLSAFDTMRTVRPGEERPLAFRASWLASTGNYTVKSWTMLSGDEHRNNDTLRQSVLVALHSVCPLAVLAPSGDVGSGYPIAPRIRVRNRGSVTDSFPVCLLIEHNAATVYRDSALCTIDPDDTAVVTLPRWVPPDLGDYQTTAWTYQPHEYKTDDDTIWDAFTVSEPRIDVAAEAVTAPAGLTGPGVVQPQVKVGNPGNVQASCWASLTLTRSGDTAYADSGWVDGVGSDEEMLVDLPPWDAQTGDYSGLLRVRCAGDVNATNDSVVRLVVIRAPGHWAEKTPLPPLPSGRQVSKGGGLTAMTGSAPTLYALKGNKTQDYYSYRPSDSAWSTLCPIPGGRENKKVGYGAALANDNGRYVYATKGNNSLGFWRYDVTRDSWSQMPDVPRSPSNKRVKAGTGMAYAVQGDTGYVYLLKGYKTDFYRFNTVSDTWHTLASAPAGGHSKWDKGSWLVCDGDHTLYAHKAKYHEFWTYDALTGSWSETPLPGMPLPGTNGKKKSKDGGCATWGSGVIYSLKGGNTQEFWAFVPGSNVWAELETLPRLGSTMKKRRVKAGAGIAYADGAAWALKGNKTGELWHYAADSRALLARTTRDGVSAAADELARQFKLSVRPNPASRTSPVCLVCRWPGPANARLTVYDIAGREQLDRNLPARLGSTDVPLRAGRLNPGIYFVRLTSGQSMLTRKLVIN
jgi:hypothetical protein